VYSPFILRCGFDHSSLRLRWFFVHPSFTLCVSFVMTLCKLRKFSEGARSVEEGFTLLVGYICGACNYKVYKSRSMKKSIYSLLLLSVLVITQSCSRSADDTNQTQVVTQNVTTGAWRVTLFTDSGNDETSDFSGYSFEFNSAGSVIATKNGTSQNGTWSINSSATKFIIDLGPKTDSNKPLGELTDDWKIISASANEIKLTDDNAASNEFLTFTRN